MIRYAIDTNIFISLYQLHHGQVRQEYSKKINDSINELYNFAFKNKSVSLYIPSTVLGEIKKFYTIDEVRPFISENFVHLPRPSERLLTTIYEAYVTNNPPLFKDENNYSRYNGYQFHKKKNGARKLKHLQPDPLILAECTAAKLPHPLCEMLPCEKLKFDSNAGGIKLITADADFFNRDKKIKSRDFIKSVIDGKPIEHKNSIIDEISEINENKFCSICVPLYPTNAVREIKNALWKEKQDKIFQEKRASQNNQLNMQNKELQNLQTEMENTPPQNENPHSTMKYFKEISGAEKEEKSIESEKASEEVSQQTNAIKQQQETAQSKQQSIKSETEKTESKFAERNKKSSRHNMDRYEKVLKSLHLENDSKTEDNEIIDASKQNEKISDVQSDLPSSEPDGR